MKQKIFLTKNNDLLNCHVSWDTLYKEENALNVVLVNMNEKKSPMENIYIVTGANALIIDGRILCDL